MDRGGYLHKQPQVFRLFEDVQPLRRARSRAIAWVSRAGYATEHCVLLPTYQPELHVTLHEHRNHYHLGAALHMTRACSCL